MALPPGYYARKSREWREKHRALGHCTRCGLPRGAGRTSVCRECVRIMMLKAAINNDCGSSTASAS